MFPFASLKLHAPTTGKVYRKILVAKFGQASITTDELAPKHGSDKISCDDSLNMAMKRKQVSV
jgi:hypothetical protein